MDTFEFVVTTEDGQATVYSDDVEQFCRSFDTEIIARNETGQPIIEGFNGPKDMGHSFQGDRLFRYEDAHTVAAIN